MEIKVFYVESGMSSPYRKREKWTKEENRVVWECYLRSEPKKRGYRKRMHAIWKEKNMKKVTEQQLCDQRKLIENKQWLEALEMELIKRNIEDTDKREKEIEVETGGQEEIQVVESLNEASETLNVDANGEEMEEMEDLIE